MHSKVLQLVIVLAALTGTTELASAQSPTSYPWCARAFKMDTSATSCYFTSRQQCMATLSGIGGYCFESPYNHASAAAAPAKSRRLRNR
jgi:hypothetical protein